MEVVICDSNLVALRGARAQPSHVPALLPKRRDREWATAPERLTGTLPWPPPMGSQWRGVDAEVAVNPVEQTKHADEAARPGTTRGERRWKRAEDQRI